MSDSIPDLYARLGVASDASADEIRTAFRRQSKRCHPDAGGSHQQMVDLLQAYEILSDPTIRAEYDRAYAQHARPGWDATYEAAAQTASSTYAAHGGSWEELTAWVDARSTHLQSSSGGRLVSGGVAGVLVGGTAGAGFGAFFGTGWLVGLVLGAACGGIAGACCAGPVAAANTDTSNT